MKRRGSRLLLVLVLAVAAVSPALAEALRLPAIIGEHMVLQRDAAAPIWGWAEPGAKVTVSFKGHEATTQADAAGRWRVDLPAMEADAQPAVMTVSSGEQTLTVGDVLVGEVWLCSGQSNMEWSVDRSANAEQEIAEANWPLIRHIKASRNPQMLPQEDNKTSWTVCSPQTVAGYTAVGYFFGRKLHQELDVPIGLLNCSWGGTRIEPWTPIEGFAAVSELSDLHRKIVAKLPDSDTYQDHAKVYVSAMSEWLAQAKQRLADAGAITEPPVYPDVIKPFTSHQDPTMLYNGMIAPFVPFTIRGSIWYQGEANRRDGMAYVDKTRALVEGWRTVWGNPGLPHYFVQIAPFKYGDENPYELPALWEAQAAIPEAIPHTGMVVVSDIGNLTNIHPTNKQDVGLRLANMALKHDYGRSDLLVRGPRFREMTLVGDKLQLTFDHVGDGLASRDGQPLTAFELAGEAQPWAPAAVEIVAPDTLVLSAEGIDKPAAVRFAWHKLAEWNLMNSAGLPAEPFRAGEEPDLSNLSLNVPEAKEYEVVYELDLARLGKDIRYDVDKSSAITAPFDRIAYYLELGDGSAQSQWVFISMGSFTDEPGKIGIPTAASGAHFQQNVADLSVRSNVPGLPNKDGLAGNIEFWPNNYAKGNQANVPGATGNAYDTGDQVGDPVDGYGSMQVHLLDPSLTVFALNHWALGNDADLGIGANKTGGEPDWTFTKSASRYTFKQLKVLVRVKR